MRLGFGFGAACFALLGLACGSSTPDEGSASGGTQSSAGASGASGQLNVNVGGRGGSEDGPDCAREVTLQAVQLGEPAPFDLVIVADHSMSLSWSRDELSRGLQDLLTNVRGRDVRVFLLTPTQYGASSSPARKPLTGDPVVAWQEPATGEAYQGAMTEYTQACSTPEGVSIECPDPKGQVPYKVHGEWKFVMPKPIATLSPEMSAEAFATQAETVKSAILASGGEGSPEEQPLCTLARYVSLPRAELPQHAVFLLISDEDDVSLPSDCLSSFDGELRSYRTEQASTPCSENCDVYRYSMPATHSWLRLPYTCAAFTDTGELIPGTEENSWYNFGSCEGVVPGDCTDAERAKVQQVCDAGLRVATCTRECATQQTTCRVDLPNDAVNACTSSFTLNGQTWQNLAQYCAQFVGTTSGTCTASGLNLQYSESRSGSSSPKSLMPGTTTADIGQYFKTTAAQVFRTGGYLLEGIVHHPSFSCTLGDGQSYAEELSRFIGDENHLFPLCGSYAPALDAVLGFAQTLVQTRFTLMLEPDEEVSDVVIIGKDGSSRKLDRSAYTFTPETGTLRIEPAAIGGSDASLKVEITSACRPIVH